MRKAIPKKVRQQVYEMYDGHCAYCGCKLEYKNMQVDHVTAVYGHGGEDCLENYKPACRQCNFYKSTLSIEKFRVRLTKELMSNLQKTFQYKLALKYGLIEENIAPVEFYFEKSGNKNE